LQASRVKLTLIILTKNLLITQLLDSKFEFAGGVANWYRLGYELSVHAVVEFQLTD